MKALRYTFVLIACLALVFAIGSVGAYEVGHISLGSLVAQCGASLAALWGSVYIINRIGEKKQ